MKYDKIEENEAVILGSHAANSPRESLTIQEAIEGGDRAEVLVAITAVNQSEQEFLEQVATLIPLPEEIQGMVEHFQDEADATRAALQQRLRQTVAEETGTNVWPAKDGMAYNGPVVDRDAIYHYQQVAPNTLIAHHADKAMETRDKGLGWMRGLGNEQEQELERAIGR